MATLVHTALSYPVMEASEIFKSEEATVVPNIVFKGGNN